MFSVVQMCSPPPFTDSVAWSLHRHTVCAFLCQWMGNKKRVDYITVATFRFAIARVAGIFTFECACVSPSCSNRLDVHFPVMWECIKNLLWIFICLWKYAHRVSFGIRGISQRKGDNRAQGEQVFPKTIKIWYIQKWNDSFKNISNSPLKQNKTEHKRYFDNCTHSLNISH